MEAPVIFTRSLTFRFVSRWRYLPSFAFSVIVQTLGSHCGFKAKVDVEKEMGSKYLRVEEVDTNKLIVKSRYKKGKMMHSFETKNIFRCRSDSLILLTVRVSENLQ